MRLNGKRYARAAGLVGLLTVGALAGCSRYYQVTDATHGDVYYTDSFPQQAYVESGQATFVDLNTGATVTLTDVHVRKVARRTAHMMLYATAPDTD